MLALIGGMGFRELLTAAAVAVVVFLVARSLLRGGGS